MFFLNILLHSHVIAVINNLSTGDMPYRRLPNTDASRQKALRVAYQRGKENPPFTLAFSQSTFQKVQSFLPTYEKYITESHFTFANQVKKSKEYQLHLHRSRMYISHFIQVMNMAVQRGELPAASRTYYGIDEHDKRLPNLNTEEAVLKWGEAIIKGEQARIMKGMSPITNPTIAVVKVRFENFVDAYHSQKTMKKSTSRYVTEMANLRITADEIITKVWDEIEESYKDLPEDLRREKCMDYGLVYVYRKNEINKLSMPLMMEMPAMMQ
jgi:hypothetical protein